MILFFVFFTLLALVFVVVNTLTRPGQDADHITGRLAAVRRSVRAAKEQQSDHELDAPDLSLRGRAEAFLTTRGFAQPLVRLCAQSGTTLSPLDLLAISSLLALFVLLAAAALTHFGLPALVASGGAALLPAMVLRLRRASRLKAFGKLMPEAIELMARSLRAGHSVQQMLEVVADQTRDPVRSEFASVHQQQKLGVPFREAMQALADRVPSQDLRFVVTAILVQKETGGDLIEILDRAALVIRDRSRVAGEVRTLTAEGRLTGWILSALPVVLLGLLLLITPSYATILLQDPIGHFLCGAGVLMILCGGYIIRRIVDVEV